MNNVNPALYQGQTFEVSAQQQMPYLSGSTGMQLRAEAERRHKVLVDQLARMTAEMIPVHDELGLIESMLPPKATSGSR